MSGKRLCAASSPLTLSSSKGGRTASFNGPLGPEHWRFPVDEGCAVSSFKIGYSLALKVYDDIGERCR